MVLAVGDYVLILTSEVCANLAILDIFTRNLRKFAVHEFAGETILTPSECVEVPTYFVL